MYLHEININIHVRYLSEQKLQKSGDQILYINPDLLMAEFCPTLPPVVCCGTQKWDVFILSVL